MTKMTPPNVSRDSSYKAQDLIAEDIDASRGTQSLAARIGRVGSSDNAAGQCRICPIQTVDEREKRIVRVRGEAVQRRRSVTA